MKRILSGIQCTGIHHLGNYLGFIQNCVKLQNEYSAYLFLADMHSITVSQDPKDLREASLKAAAAYIACGIKPDKAAIFAQSTVKEHAELSWIFSCIARIGWLNRMTQFKDKAGNDKEQASLGLYSYPVLMAADILLYHPQFVPVGADQKQHLELTRDIAMAFNREFKCEYFKLPEPLIIGEATRVMSLRDGKSKMSKSDSSDYARINLTDDKDLIMKKMQKAKSDSIAYISYDIDARPEVSNLINIFSELSGISKENIVKQYTNSGFAKFKGDLAELIIEKITPIGNNINKIFKDETYLLSVLKDGQLKASEVASITINEVKKLIGFINFK